MGWVGPALGGGAAAAVGGQGDRPDDEQRAALPPARVHRRGEAAAPRRGESRIELETGLLLVKSAFTFKTLC